MFNSILNKTVLSGISFAALATFTTIIPANARNFTVPANSQGTIGVISIYSESTCYAGALPQVYKKTADHGKITLQKYSYKPESGPCKGSLFKGYKVIYTTKRGFRGTDNIQIKFRYPRYENRSDMTRKTIRHRITVK